MNYHMNNRKLVRFICSLSALVMSICSLGVVSFAWYSTSRQVSTTINSVSALTNNITSYSLYGYRSDSVYYDFINNVKYENGASSSSTAFNMLDYDCLIPDKNTLNNLVLKLSLTFNANYSTDHEVQLTFTTPNSTKFATSNSSYHLSDAIGIAGMANAISSAVTDSYDIYSNATTAMADSTSSLFIPYTLTDGTYTFGDKSTSLVFDFPLTESVKTYDIYLNVTYSDPLVKYIANLSNGGADITFDKLSSLTLSLVGDLSVTIQLRSI